ncbi:MAG: GAF domain-containing protein [Chloroflexi bacterium]|nr:GAF domain-containing protein [Chloroflexota bacterium]
MIQTIDFWQAALENIPYAVAVLNERGEVVYANHNQQLPVPLDTGNNFLDFCYQQARISPVAARLVTGLAAVLNGDEETYAIEHSASDLDDASRSVLNLSRFVWDEKSYVLMTHNHTGAVSQAEQVAEQHKLALALSDSALALTSTLDTDNVMRIILEKVGDVVPNDAANIMLLDGDKAQIAYWHGYAPEHVSHFAEFRPSLQLTHLHKMLETRQPQLISHTSQCEYWVRAPGSTWIESYIGVPIKLRDSVIGFLNLDSSTPGFYTAYQIAPLQLFAGQIAVAIENGQMYEELNRRHNEAVSLNRAMSLLISSIDETTDIETLASQIAETVARTFHFVNCAVVLVDKESNKVHYVARVGDTYSLNEDTISLDETGIFPTAIQKKAIVYRPDLKVGPHRSELVVPLINHEEEVIGALDLQSVDRDAFTMRDQHALQAFAAKAATIIENARLYNRVQGQTEELERRVAERTAQLRHEKDRAEAIFHHTNDAIILTTSDGVIRQINRACAQLFDYADIVGTTIFKLVMPDYQDLMRDYLQRAAQRGSYQRAEVVALGTDNTPFAAEVAFSAFDRDGTDRLVICSFHDITHHKRLQASLRKSLDNERKLGELKSRFVSMASHEFRTPLTTILASSEYVRQYRDRIDDAKIERKLSLVRDQVKYMVRLLDDVLTFGRLDSGRAEIQVEEVNLISLCEQIVEEATMAEAVTHEVNFSHEMTEAVVKTDKHLLRAVITNLLSNAIKYSPGETSVDFSVLCDGQMIYMTVSDHGIGIPEEDHKHVFDPFHRASNVGPIHGTGLGLAIIKRQLELIGGTISFQSVPGEGTTFMVEIPVLKE